MSRAVVGSISFHGISTLVQSFKGIAQKIIAIMDDCNILSIKNCLAFVFVFSGF